MPTQKQKIRSLFLNDKFILCVILLNSCVIYAQVAGHEGMLLNVLDMAWTYHPLEDDEPNSVYNAQCYYDYMSDVVNYYCGKDDKPAALQFTKQHIIWFVKNVDNEKNDKYSDYQSEKVKNRLMKYIENY